MKYKKSIFAFLGLAALVYISIGIFPVAPIESDSVAISNGVELMHVEGIGSNNFTYRYHAQPGTYFIIFLISSMGIPALTAFSVISIFAGIVSLVLLILIIKRLTTLPYWPIIIGLALVQEIFVCLYYPSSTIIASMFVMGAYFLLIRRKSIYSVSLLYAIAVWMRFDVILTVFFFLFKIYENRISFSKKAGAILFALLIIVVLFRIVNADMSEIIKESQAHIGQTYNGSTGFALLSNVDIRSFLSVFSLLTMVLFLYGTCLVIRRDWKKTVVFCIALLPFFLVFHGKITTPKYFYYYLPIFVYPISVALANKPKPKWFYLCVVLLFQYFIGIQCFLTSKPHIKEVFPKIIHLAEMPVNSQKKDSIEIVIGAGAAYPTADFFRLSSGLMYSPLFWNHEKKRNIDEIHDFIAYIDSCNKDSLTIVTSRYASFQTVFHVLINNGFQYHTYKEYNNGNDKDIYLTKNNKEVKLIKRFYPETAYLTFDKSNITNAMITTQKGDVFFTIAPWEIYISNECEIIESTDSEFCFIRK